MSLLDRLLVADVVCKDCGERYGKYSVGVSSTWMGTCNVCDQYKPITEVRDWGYLTKGIHELKIKANIKEQSKQVADYMATVGPIMSDEELEDELTVSYEKGEITLKLTEDEVSFLHECLDTIQKHHPSLEEHPIEDVPLFEGLEKKIVDLYEDNCIKYFLSPAAKAFIECFGEKAFSEKREWWDAFKAGYNSSSEKNA